MNGESTWPRNLGALRWDLWKMCGIDIWRWEPDIKRRYEMVRHRFKVRVTEVNSGMWCKW